MRGPLCSYRPLIGFKNIHGGKFRLQRGKLRIRELLAGQTFFERLQQDATTRIPHRFSNQKRLNSKGLGDAKTELNVCQTSFSLPGSQARRGPQLEQRHDLFAMSKMGEEDAPRG